MKELEDIILEKEYFELTSAEKEAIQEMADNEEDYAAIKWFLKQQQGAKQATIIPSKKLKDNVFAQLDNPANKRIWLSGSGAGLATPKKKIYQMPAFQIGIAACLVVGFLWIVNPFSKEDNTLAQNTEQIEEGSDKVSITTKEETLVEDSMSPITQEVMNLNEEAPDLDLLDQAELEELDEEISFEEITEKEGFYSELEKDRDKNQSEFTFGRSEQAKGTANGGSVALNNNEQDNKNTQEEIAQPGQSNSNPSLERTQEAPAMEDEMEAADIVVLSQNTDNSPTTTVSSDITRVNKKEKVSRLMDESTVADKKDLANAISIQESMELNQLFFTVP